MDKITQLLRSRKFWAFVLAVIVAVSLFATGQVNAWEMLQAIVAAAAAYSTGVAVEDAGHAIQK